MEHSKIWITLSPNINRAVEIMKQIDGKKLSLFLNRIILEMKQHSNSLKPFSEEEKEKLQISFSINSEELNILLCSSILILSQALYHITNPEVLYRTLINDLKLDAEKALVFANVWSNHAKSLILKFKQKTYSTQIEDVSWLVNIETSSDNGSQTFNPKAVVQLKLKNEAGLHNLHLELNEKHLFNMYNTLEIIQHALDKLS